MRVFEIGGAWRRDGEEKREEDRCKRGGWTGEKWKGSGDRTKEKER